jgi:hypothetical protein
MSAGRVYKFSDWRFIWLNSLISEPEGDNHQKENGVIAKYSKLGRGHQYTNQDPIILHSGFAALGRLAR